jgi:hypothetical protein
MTSILNEQLVGSWTLVAGKSEFENGDVMDIYGPNPAGSIIFTSNNRMMAVVTSRSRSASASPDELFRTMMAYTGTFDLKGNELTVAVDVAWVPGWVGAKQTRFLTLDDDLLDIRTPKQDHPLFPGKKVVGLLTWRKERVS